MLKRRKTFLFNNFWIILGLGTLIIRTLFGLFPTLTELVYSQGLFLVIRTLIDNTFGKLSFPTIYLVIFFLGAFIARKIKDFDPTQLKTLNPKKTAHTILSIAGFLAFFFFTLWGFNYARLPLTDKLEINEPTINNDLLIEEALTAIDSVNLFRCKFSWKNHQQFKILDNVEEITRVNLKKTLNDLGYNYSGNIRCKSLLPTGILRNLGIKGIYFPFVGEAYLDASLHEVEIPFSMAHEMAHGLGFASEGTANFIAYLTCVNSPDYRLKYSGYFNYLLYLFFEIKKISPERLGILKEKLNEEVFKDFEDWKTNRKINTGQFIEVTNFVNNQYLKAQGVKEGSRSYNKVIDYVIAWKEVNLRKNLN